MSGQKMDSVYSSTKSEEIVSFPKPLNELLQYVVYLVTIQYTKRVTIVLILKL